MRGRLSRKSMFAAGLAVALLTGCTGPAPAPSITSAVPPAGASGSASDVITGRGFRLKVPAGYVDVTERAAKTILATPLGSDKDVTVVWVGVEATDPGDLGKALIVATLASGPEPETAARSLGALAGSASGSSRVVGAQTWYTFPAALGSIGGGAGLGAITRFSQMNVLLAEAGSGVDAAHPTLWATAATLDRA